MYLSANDARGKSRLDGSKLSGMGFAWSDITSGLKTLLSSKEATQLATQLIVKPVPVVKPAPTLKPTSLTVGSGGGTMPTQYAAPTSTIWSNKWTWVAAGAGLLLAGTALAIVMRRRD